MKRYIVAIVFGFLLSAVAIGEMWPPLETFVNWSFLIVKCKPQIVGDRIDYGVVEVWKGTNTINVFHEAQPDGAFWSVGYRKEQILPQATVFFCTLRNVPTWAEGKSLGPSAAFDVHDGKLIYAPTSEAGLRKEYTIDDFKKAVISAIESQREHSAEQAVAGCPPQGVGSPDP